MWGRGRVIIAGAASAAAAAAVLVVTIAGGGGGPPGGNTANIWVSTTGNAGCTRSASLIEYGSANPCANLNGAYAIAQAGDLVRVKAGSYSGETISYRAALDGLTPGCDPYGEWGTASTANCVKYVPDGGTITFTGNLWFRGSNVWLAGTATGSWSNPWTRTYDVVLNDAEGEGTVYASSASSTQEADHIVVEGVDAGTFQIEADYVHFRDYNAGPSNRDPGPTCSEPESKVVGNSWKRITNVTLERLFIHGQTTSDAGNCHTGGFITWGTDNFRISQSAITDNAVYGILFETFGGPPAAVTIENTWFGCVNAGDGSTANLGTCDAGKPGMSFKDGPYPNYTIRFNSSRSNAILDGTFSGTSNFVANIWRPPLSSDPFCSTSNGLTKDYNVWVGTSSNLCGGTNGTAVLDMTTIFTNFTYQSEDFHLLNGTNVANNFVAPSPSPYNLAVDVDGETRPIGVNRDAGIDER